MIRSILPVGQGQCCIESFKENKFVFDCGSISPGKAIFNTLIPKYFQKNEKVEAVFLSHLDADHVNGVDFLLSYCNVKRIFVPFLSEDARLLHSIQYLMKPNSISSGFLYTILTNSNFSSNSFNYRFDKEKEPVIVFPVVTEALENEFIDPLSGRLTKQQTEILGFDWNFIPFNFEETTRTKQFRTLISANPLLKDITPSKLAEKWTSYKLPLWDVYQSTLLDGEINTNSLVVYSGPGVAKYSSNNLPLSELNSDMAGCLYTGDYDASISIQYSSLIRHFFPIIDQIGTLLIPHHGSTHSFNVKFCYDFSGKFIVSAGIKSKHHPHRDVLVEMLIRYKTPIVVTEESLAFDEYIGCD